MFIQWQIQDFPEEAPTFDMILAKNCMKRGCASLAPLVSAYAIDCELETSSQSLETVLAISGLVNMSTIHKAASSLVTGHFQNAATRIAPRDHSPINGFSDIFTVDSGMME